MEDMAWLLVVLSVCFVVGLLSRSWLLGVGVALAVALYGSVIWLVHKDDNVQENWSAAGGQAILFFATPIVFLATAAGVAFGRSRRRRDRSPR